MNDLYLLLDANVLGIVIGLLIAFALLILGVSHTE